jgi:hypothetical protein
MSADEVLAQLRNIVQPALKDYTQAEHALTEAHKTGEKADIRAARGEVMRKARTAAIELHQLCDVALHELSPTFSNIGDVRSAVQANCTFLRSAKRVEDVDLLRDTAEVFKHHTLDRSTAAVKTQDMIVAATTGYSTLFFGEGKYGGAEAVIVTKTNGSQRALSSILQNVFDAWLMFLKEPLPPIGNYA